MCLRVCVCVVCKCAHTCCVLISPGSLSVLSHTQWVDAVRDLLLFLSELVCRRAVISHTASKVSKLTKVPLSCVWNFTPQDETLADIKAPVSLALLQRPFSDGMGKGLVQCSFSYGMGKGLVQVRRSSMDHHLCLQQKGRD